MHTNLLIIEPYNCRAMKHYYIGYKTIALLNAYCGGNA